MAKSQVMFYGNLQKAQMLLACVQASITDCSTAKAGRASRAVLDRYVAELEEIETDLVALINAAISERDGEYDATGRLLDKPDPTFQ